MGPRRWIRLELALPESYHDLLTGQLAPLGFLGFEQHRRALHCYLQKTEWNRELRSRVTSILSRFQHAFPSLRIASKTKTIQEIHWNKVWEESVGIIEATDRIIIQPSWKKSRRREHGKIVVCIDPKMSFGTGHHETTRLSLSLLQEYISPNSHVLDFGCGTGILAIAAAKLGAKSILAVDNDSWAASNAEENVRKNAVAKLVRIVKGDAKSIPARRFDLIAANIDLPTILRSFSVFTRRLKPQGILILSGLLTSDLPTLLSNLNHRELIPLELLKENEWVGMALVHS